MEGATFLPHYTEIIIIAKVMLRMSLPYEPMGLMLVGLGMRM
jgi:hypothetical protein